MRYLEMWSESGREARKMHEIHTRGGSPLVGARVQIPSPAVNEVNGRGRLEN